ncbi:MAG: energy-coupling factor ABC transporter ATP-binding protein [Candidatus Helarchaeota archaeon]
MEHNEHNNYIIQVKDLNYKIKNRTKYFELQEISFNVKKGQKFAISGPNGSGKTTIFRLMVNLIKPKSGYIKIGDIEVNKKNAWQVRKKIGFLFQNPDDQLFAPTIWEDVAFGPRNMKLSEEEVKDRVTWALESVNISELKDDPPNNLSWGQKKRAALAGVLAMKPEILFLDEPFANLDIPTIKELILILNKLISENQLTILFTTHNYFFIEHWADGVLILNNGKVIFNGDPQDALNDLKVQKAIGTWDEIMGLIK